MKTFKRKTRTDLTELVETHNIYLSLKRLREAPYDSERWKRALYHALCMSGACHRELSEKIRQALELP